MVSANCHQPFRNQPRRGVRVALLLLITAVGLGPASMGHARPAADPYDARPRRFAVGFLPEGSDFAEAPRTLELLRLHLLRTARVHSALQRAGFGEIQLSPCDGPRDMVQRMEQGEFHLVLATAVVYARQRGPYGPPILQTRRPGDFEPRGGGVMRRGVVFVAPPSPLFGVAEPEPLDVRNLLASSPLAVPSADSAAGYIYPRLLLHRDYDLARPFAFWFCGDDHEVVKHVVSGLAAVGACREGALDELLGPDTERFTRVLFRTDPFPTDPIVVRRELQPAGGSTLGIELKAALRAFFNEQHRGRDGLRVENASPAGFESLQRALQALDRLVQPLPAPPPSAGDAPATPAAPRPTPEYTPLPLLTPRVTNATTATLTPEPTPELRPELPELRPELPEFLFEPDPPADEEAAPDAAP